MPYIKADRRLAFSRIDPVPETPGELNYLITILLKDYMERHDTSYKVLNDVLGAVEGSKLEFYRRVAVPYENLKAQENGDVYEA